MSRGFEVLPSWSPLVDLALYEYENSVKLGRIHEQVYMYSLRFGKLTVSTGSLSRSSRGRGNFRPDSRHCTICSPESGVVYNAYLWLFERDDAKAKKIFIEHKNAAITTLQKEIERNLSHIKIIEDFNDERK